MTEAILTGTALMLSSTPALARGGWGGGGIGLIFLIWILLAFIGPKLLALIGFVDRKRAGAANKIEEFNSNPLNRGKKLALRAFLLYGTLLPLLALLAYLAFR